MIRHSVMETDARGAEFFTSATEGKPCLGSVAWRALFLCNPGGARGGPRDVLRALCALDGLPTGLVGADRLTQDGYSYICRCVNSAAVHNNTLLRHETTTSIYVASGPLEVEILK